MARYVALLRGVNVGRANRISMARWRELLEAAGMSEVRTLLQSGNAVVTSALESAGDLAGRIEADLLAHGDLAVRCLVIEADELRSAIDTNPMPEHAEDGAKLLCYVCSAELDAGLAAANHLDALAPGDIVWQGRFVYQWCPEGVLHAPALMPVLERHLGVVATARNWNTFTKLAGLL